MDVLKDLGLYNPQDHNLHLIVYPFIKMIVSNFYDQENKFLGTALTRSKIINLIKYAQLVEGRPEFLMILPYHGNKPKGLDSLVGFFETYFLDEQTTIIDKIKDETLNIDDESLFKLTFEDPFGFVVAVTCSFVTCSLMESQEPSF